MVDASGQRLWLFVREAQDYKIGKKKVRLERGQGGLTSREPVSTLTQILFVLKLPLSLVCSAPLHPCGHAPSSFTGKRQNKDPPGI